MNRFVRSREHLLHLLAEAAELEHNLLCSYLYAAFSLKRGADEDLLPDEHAAVQRWREVILGVCMEEMTHLAQVANLMVAVGSRPHFDRPNLPVAPGYHPAGLQVRLAAFDLDTLEHFIFLERPDCLDIADGAGYALRTNAVPRGAEVGVLMPSAPDYATIGAFYKLLNDGLVELTSVLGERGLFIGPPEHQLRAAEIGAAELTVVVDLQTACRALQLIIIQGEGSTAESEASHFQKFSGMRDEYLRLLKQRASFFPSRPVARNPVMRFPQADDRVHIDAEPAALTLDAANAVYSLMLRCLVAVYETPWQAVALRSALLAGATGLMKVMAELAATLTTLPAHAAELGVTAGISFAMLRATEALAPGVDAASVLLQRLDDVARQLPHLPLQKVQLDDLRKTLGNVGNGLRNAAIAAVREGG